MIELDNSISNAEGYIIPLMIKEHENTIAAPGTWSTITGWGRMIPDNQRSIPNILMQLETPIVAQDACRDAWSTVNIPILGSMVCAGFEAGGSSVCQGDSGGALVVTDHYGRYVQNGIVSFGPGTCAEPGRVPVYTRVSSYIGWIETVTGIDFTTPRAPDLVIDDVYLNENQNLEIVIRNQGNARIALDQGFWVDLYIDPDPVPNRVNQTWNFLSKSGAVWGIDRTGLVLLPGQIEIITLNDEYFWPTLSVLPEIDLDGHTYYFIPPGTVFYLQIDSANANTDYGAILERHELFGEGALSLGCL